MCQGYDAERAMIVAGEQYATLRGFAAARSKKSKETNPYHKKGEMYNHKAWNHGWDCWNDPEPLLPWALESRYRELIREKHPHSTMDIRLSQQATDEFRKTRKLPKELEELVERYVG